MRRVRHRPDDVSRPYPGLAQVPNVSWSGIFSEDAGCSALPSRSPLSKDEPVEVTRVPLTKRQEVGKEKAAVDSTANSKTKIATREQLLARACFMLQSTGIPERLAALRLGSVDEKREEGIVALFVDILALSPG